MYVVTLDNILIKNQNGFKLIHIFVHYHDQLHLLIGGHFEFEKISLTNKFYTYILLIYITLNIIFL